MLACYNNLFSVSYPPDVYYWLYISILLVLLVYSWMFLSPVYYQEPSSTQGAREGSAGGQAGSGELIVGLGVGEEEMMMKMQIFCP